MRVLSLRLRRRDDYTHHSVTSQGPRICVHPRRATHVHIVVSSSASALRLRLRHGAPPWQHTCATSRHRGKKTTPLSALRRQLRSIDRSRQTLPSVSPALSRLVSFRTSLSGTRSPTQSVVVRLAGHHAGEAGRLMPHSFMGVIGALFSSHAHPLAPLSPHSLSSLSACLPIYPTALLAD